MALQASGSPGTIQNGRATALPMHATHEATREGDTSTNLRAGRTLSEKAWRRGSHPGSAWAWMPAGVRELEGGGRISIDERTSSVIRPAPLRTLPNHAPRPCQRRAPDNSDDDIDRIAGVKREGDAACPWIWQDAHVARTP